MVASSTCVNFFVILLSGERALCCQTKDSFSRVPLSLPHIVVQMLWCSALAPVPLVSVNPKGVLSLMGSSQSWPRPCQWVLVPTSGLSGVLFLTPHF